MFLLRGSYGEALTQRCGALPHSGRGALPQEGWCRAQLISRLPSPRVVLLLTVVLQEQRGTRKSVQIATADSSLHCLWREEERCPFPAQDLAANVTHFSLRARTGCSHTPNLPQVHSRENVHDLEFGILYPSPKPISFFLPFSFLFFLSFFKAGSHHETNGTNLTL